uniref:Uncharacterized protein n=1 Tax=Aegilops tauschii subsp. strangulata TaxID=200361 RepID=A0A453DM96_AEGTS
LTGACYPQASYHPCWPLLKRMVIKARCCWRFLAMRCTRRQSFFSAAPHHTDNRWVGIRQLGEFCFVLCSIYMAGEMATCIIALLYVWGMDEVLVCNAIQVLAGQVFLSSLIS